MYHLAITVFRLKRIWLGIIGVNNSPNMRFLIFLFHLQLRKSPFLENIRKIVHGILAFHNKNQSDGWFMERTD